MAAASSFEYLFQIHFYDFVQDNDMIHLMSTCKRLYRPFLHTYKTKQQYAYSDIRDFIAKRLFNVKVYFTISDKFSDIITHPNVKSLVLLSSHNYNLIPVAPYIKTLSVLANVPITAAQYPNLTDLYINNNNHFTQYVDDLPSTLLKLTLYSGFIDKSIDHLLPNLVELLLDYTFNRRIDLLPNSLTKLEFVIHGQFNQPVDHLPSSLLTLILPESFNQPIDHLPQSLQTLSLGRHFNQPVDQLPSYLQILILGDTFNHPIDHLPPGLLTLELGDSFDQPLHLLPHTITDLRVASKYFNQSVDHLPQALKTLQIGDDVSSDSVFNQPINNLPKGLLNLKICGAFNQSVDKLPPQLLQLDLYSSIFNQSIDRIPHTIISLELPDEFNQEIKRLPKYLQYLIFGSINSQFNQILLQHVILSTQLKHLSITGSIYDKYIHFLPRCIKHLGLNTKYPHALEQLKMKYPFLSIY